MTQARWLRAEPRRRLPPDTLERVVRAALPGSRLIAARPLGDGLRNANFRLFLESPADPVVLRIYEHDPSLCRKEIDLFRLLSDTVPVPQILHAQPDGLDDLPPFTVARYIEAVTLHELKRGGDRGAIAQAALSAGRTLAAISRVQFDKPGWLSPGPTVTVPLLDGPDPTPRFIDTCLTSPVVQQRMPSDVRDRVSTLGWSAASELALLDRETRLVHGDFGKRNLLVRSDAERWSVAGVLDWEFAVSGSPLIDVGHLLRYERASNPLLEPHFSNGFTEAGGVLPNDWRRLARIVDLAALCESLTHEALPHDTTAEIAGLVRTTCDDYSK